MQVFLGLVISIFVCADTRQAKLDAEARVADDDLEPDGGALVLGVCLGKVQQVAPLHRSIFPHCVFHILDLSVPHFKMS